VTVDRALLLRIEPGRIDLPRRHPEQEELLVLPVVATVVAELGDLMPDRLAEITGPDPQPGLLEELPRSTLGRRLALVEAAAGGEPPPQPRPGRIAAA
jgi:hypothetical protein